MPSKTRKDGQFKDIAHPLTQETRDTIERMVFEAYELEIRTTGESLQGIKLKTGGDY